MGNEASYEEKLNEEDFNIALYEKVRAFHEENAAKITGMLLEMPQNDLKNVFADDTKLMSQIYEAIKILGYETDKEKRESLGDVLYLEVEAVYSDHAMAEKITGMLLEMKVEDLEKLVEDKSNLLVKIHEAADVLQRHKVVEHFARKTIVKTLPSKAELGEKIFKNMLQWYPDEETAAKLTGMVLEMNVDEISELTQDNELLKCKADEADRALRIQK